MMALLQGLVVIGRRRTLVSLLRPSRALRSIPSSNASSLKGQRWFPVRSLAMSSGGDFALLQVIRDEIDNEKEIDLVSFEEGKRKPPAPFTISDRPGAHEVCLYRSYGKEDISISCLFHTENYPPEDEEDEAPPTQMVQMKVTIKKGGDDPYLQILCCSNGDEPVIQGVSYKENGLSPEEVPYEGPNFMDVDNNMKKGFIRYLNTRGVDAQLADFLIHYMYHKEQREYSRWLRKVEGFIKK